ncbi:MAG: hypothetical protein IT342_02585 [Candidatus Melainabacteria bacterium]|nr:hypothetical protein [Candidatus Melainabacteria bacterium]
MADKQILYSISIGKLIILNSLFFGMYAMFWMFMNWKYLHEREQVKCFPAARALFAPLFFFALAPKMIDLITKHGGKAPPTPPVVLALIYFAGNFIGRIEHPACILLSLLNVVPLAMLQKAINDVNGGPDAVLNQKFSIVNWVFMVLGGLLWGLVIFSMFVKT